MTNCKTLTLEQSFHSTGENIEEESQDHDHPGVGLHPHLLAVCLHLHVLAEHRHGEPSADVYEHGDGSKGMADAHYQEGPGE